MQSECTWMHSSHLSHLMHLMRLMHLMHLDSLDAALRRRFAHKQNEATATCMRTRWYAAIAGLCPHITCTEDLHTSTIPMNRVPYPLDSCLLPPGASTAVDYCIGYLFLMIFPDLS